LFRFDSSDVRATSINVVFDSAYFLIHERCLGWANNEQLTILEPTRRETLLVHLHLCEWTQPSTKIIKAGIGMVCSTVRLTSIYYRIPGNWESRTTPIETIDGHVKKIRHLTWGIVWRWLPPEIWLVIVYIFYWGLIHLCVVC
jgi:hypothetical protein